MANRSVCLNGHPLSYHIFSRKYKDPYNKKRAFSVTETGYCCECPKLFVNNIPFDVDTTPFILRYLMCSNNSCREYSKLTTLHVYCNLESSRHPISGCIACANCGIKYHLINGVFYPIFPIGNGIAPIYL